MQKYFLLFLLPLLFLAACNNDNTPSYPVRIMLTDAPGDFEEVLIDVQRVEVNAQNNDNNGWQTLNTNAKVYDLTQLTNGAEVLLADGNLPHGKISQVRLVLGNNNSVKIDGQTYPLATPSAQQSGLKLNVHETLTEGVTYSLTLDFDAARSIVSQGNGGYSLKPVIRAFTTPTSGAIKGVVDPANTFAKVYAIMGTDSFGTLTNNNGQFLIPGLGAGNYNVAFEVPSMNNKIISKTASVTIGQVTDMGVVKLD